ncbi:MAG: ATP phosphoribosyltransferase [Acidimicrobiia bacterium]|nr:ATP phosphoribosyltransferase [Acidimicrobiia bacterium]NNF62785.1 ATP phosphoribosyltransferase [Acidimicrobiia bacterium]
MTIRLALPNKGRLEDPTQRLLADAGLVFEKTARSLTVPALNVDIELLFVRADDVVELVSDGVAELGVTGLDLVSEAPGDVSVLTHLGYGRCRLVAAVPNNSEVESISEFEGLRVATTHVRATKAFFDAKSIDITVIPLHGSVEAAPKLGVADAIADLVSSGSTMLVNGLRPVTTILESEAVLIGQSDQAPQSEIRRLVTMVKAVTAGRRKRYLLMNAPSSAVAAIEALIPGLAAPSVVPLAHDDMVAIHSVVDTADLWDVLPQLEDAGASGILVLPVEQLIP